MGAPSKDEIAAVVREARAGETSLQLWAEDVIVALADEVERLRNGKVRPIPWTDDEIKELIKEAVENDPNGKCIHCGGVFPKAERNHWRDCPNHTARIEVERLRAERIEVLALDTQWPLTSILERLCEATDHLLSAHSCDRLGYEGVVAARDAGRILVAKLRGAT